MAFIFKGAGVALVTPFTETGVNFDLLGRLIDRQIEAGINAIIALGTTGEPCTMTLDERETTARFCMERVSGRVPVVIGCGGNDTRACVGMAKRMRDLGADALLIVTPYYNRATQQGLIAHYTAIADAVDIPIMMYNVPSRTGVNMLPETAAILAEHPMIAAYKEASESIEQFAQDCRLLEGHADVFSGNDSMALASMAVGGRGIVSVAANVDPSSVASMTDGFFSGDMDAARMFQSRIALLSRALFSEVSPIPCKAALEMLGFPVGSPRLPLTPMSEVGREMLAETLRELELL